MKDFMQQQVSARSSCIELCSCCRPGTCSSANVPLFDYSQGFACYAVCGTGLSMCRKIFFYLSILHNSITGVGVSPISPISPI